jgi:hypothetical protein
VGDQPDLQYRAVTPVAAGLPKFKRVNVALVLRLQALADTGFEVFGADCIRRVLSSQVALVENRDVGVRFRVVAQWFQLLQRSVSRLDTVECALDFIEGFRWRVGFGS